MTKVIITGEMYYSDLSIGGGPIIPAPQPPGIWGPTDPRPTNPIAGPGRPPWWGMANDPGYGIPVGPVDPGYSPPWARPGGGPVDPGYSPPWAQAPSGPVDPGYSPPWARPTPGVPTHPIYIPPQAPPIDPADPTKAYLVAYVPKSDGSGYERVTFTVDVPPPTVPTEPTPKPV